MTSTYKAETIPKKINWVHANCSVSDSSEEAVVTSSDASAVMHEKDYSRVKFLKNKQTNGQRSNHKEQRIREWKKKFKPHSDDGIDIDPTTAERNRLAHLVNETPSAPYPDSKAFENLLHSVRDAPTLLGERSPELDEWIGHLENLAVLGYQMSRADGFTDVFVAIVAYAKMYTKSRSLLLDLYKLIDEVTKTCPDEEIEPQAWTGRDAMEKWNLFKTNAIFTKISYLITAAMSLTVCSIKKIEWSPMGLKLISLEAATKQLEAVDLIDALINTFVWIAEVGHRVIAEKSLSPLLYSDAQLESFNKDCDYVLSHAEAVLAGNSGDMNDFENLLDKVTTRVCEMKVARANGAVSIWLQQKYSELVGIKQKIIAKRKNTALRFSPIGWSLTGPTAVGKSTLGKLTMKTSLHSMGFTCSADRILTRDIFDKYDSTMTSDIEGVFMDDVGNGKSNFATEAPTSVIIKFFNNVAAQAVKAELNLKGVTFIEFKCGVITSNLEGFDAASYTNCVESIHRRFFHVKVAIKEKYRARDSVSINSHHPDLVGAELTHDVWSLSVSECRVYEHKPGETTSRIEIMTVDMPDGRKLKCENLGLEDYLKVVIHLSQRHRDSQQSVLKRSAAFDTMKMCSECCLPSTMCKCVQKIEPDALEHIGDLIVNSAKRSIASYLRSWMGPVGLFNSLLGYSPIKNLTTKTLSREITDALHAEVTPLIISVTPEWVFRTRLFHRSMTYWQRSAALYNLKPHMKALSIATTLGLGFGVYKRDSKIVGATFGLSWIGTCFLYTNYKRRIATYKKEYLQRRDALTEAGKTIRDGPLPKGVFVVSTMIIGLKLFKMWNATRQKDLDPDSISRASIDGQPTWFGHMMQRMGVAVGAQAESSSANPTQVGLALEKVQYWANFTRADGSHTRCNIFFPRKCVAWIPLHIFYPKSDMSLKPIDLLDVEVLRFKGATGHFNFKCRLSQSSIMKDLDMVAIYVPNAFDSRDVLKWLPTTKPVGVSSAQLQVRSKELDVLRRTVTVECGQKGHRYKDFYGGSYTTDLAQIGACMSPVIADRKNPVILGFHIGGNANLKHGVMQTVTLSQALEAIDALERIPGVLLSSNADDLPEKQYEEPVLWSPDVHPHSMAVDLKTNGTVEIFGATKLRTQQKSVVVPSFITDSVEKHTGVSNTWAGPKLRPNWKGFNATLEHIAAPSDMFDPALVERARQDWLSDIRPLMHEHCLKEAVRPLTLKESILGQDGVRFIDAIPMDTGMGYPLFGPKKNHFEEIRDGEKLIDRIPDEGILKEMDRLMDCWQKGVRGYPVTTATLKDEPTPIAKEKVRVFQAISVAFGLQIRKYFLPISRFLHMYPLEVESAVGINPFSPQWEPLLEHAHRYGKDDVVIAWDYAKYDVRMSSQMTKAALLSYIELAEIAQYSAEDIQIMKMMVNDLVHPLMDYNGTLLMAFNMNTSGNNMTVDINSSVGAMYVRMGVFHALPEVKRVRDVAAVSTYGDDLTGSVKAEYRDKFNFKVFKEFMAAHKIKVTLPDKSDNVSLFMKKSDADFLKRTTQFIPEIGYGIGKLDEKSIFKSLHSNLLSRTASPREVATSCVETALHEWFAYGRDHYEMRRSQMQAVCDDMDLPILALNYTYDNRVDSWKEKYVT